MARSERQEGGTRGGIGTLTRPGTRPRRAPEAGQAAPDLGRGRPARPVPPRRPVGDQQQRSTGGRRADGQRADASQAVAAPQHPGTRRPGSRLRVGVPPQTPAVERGAPQRVRATGPQPTLAPPQPSPVSQAAQPRKTDAPAGSHRMPFVLLLCGLLGGALISALVISTTLAEGSFQISKLQNSTSSLVRQQQLLEQEVAQAQSPQQIAQRATQLGMRRPGELQFIDLKTGKVTNDGPTWSGAINAPGYVP